MDPTAIWPWIDKAGLVGALFLFAVAILKGWLVPGYIYQDLANREKEAREALVSGVRLVDRAASKP